ncbi:universal stress protein [Pseudarthrobacter sp. J1738]|uniref:universal stress protein n=1 Tax=unclassified Pseudarthrobacter TaxID=2647000 RepID=UPI003D2CEFAC
MRYVVGYTPNERGADAVNLAVAMAAAQGAHLDLVYVQDKNLAATSLTNPGGASGVKTQALALIPAGVPAEFHLIEGESFAAALIECAIEFKAGLIVIGAASNGLFKRYTVGSVANALLHASPVPVALVPRGYQRQEPIDRLTLAVGTREGADAAINIAISSAGRRGVPLRLISLVELDVAGESGEGINAAHRHANTVLKDAAAQLSPGHDVQVAVAHGRTIEEAIDGLEWSDGDALVVGSSRLARRRQLFIGSTANKVLRSLPVPMIVVPRDYERIDSSPEK